VFGPNFGAGPQGALLQGSDGTFYGTTVQGSLGGTQYGTVFTVTPAGTLTTLLSFSNTNSPLGSFPFEGLIEGSDGNFYGTTGGGGINENGTIFKMTTDGTLVGTILTTLVDFTGTSGNFKGGEPRSVLFQSNDGAFYGTTARGGVLM